MVTVDLAIQHTSYADLDVAGFEAAVSQLCNPVRVVASDPQGFRAAMTQRRIQGVAFADIRGVGPVRLERDDELIGIDPSHMVKVSLQLEGNTVAGQGGRRLCAEPGDLLIYDTAQPYTITHERAFRVVVIQAPHVRVGVSDTAMAAVAPALVTGSDGLGRIISPFLAGLGSGLDRLDAGTASQLTDNAMGLLRALLASRMDVTAVAASPEWQLRQGVFDFIDEHLADPGLSPPRVAMASYVSTRKLHSLFQELGTTVSIYIRSRRLEKCYLALSDPEQVGVTVAAVGARWGFPDAAHFNRVFKRAYRETPGEVRRRALTRQPGPAAS